VIARDVGEQRGTTLEGNARLFALLNFAEADAGIVSWDCKYRFEFWRPVTAIVNGDLDGNPATEKEAGWTPLLVTPPFPEYTSGHSTFSGAAAAVLAGFFGSDDIAFSTGSEDLAGVVRSFSSFSEAAQEAGISRIYGGIHFLSANEAGLTSGAELGAYVTANFLRDRPGDSHRGK
jgi:membrane-associated phospholipid phosphatase